MIEIADAGEIKAVVKIEYDGSGIQKAKEDLASLSDAVGGGLEQGTKSASDALSGLDEQMGKNAGSAKTFASALDELPKIAESGSSTISEMTGMLSEHQSAIEEAGTAYESFSENVQKASKTLKDGVESANLQNANFNTVAQMWADPEPFEMLQQHLQTTGQSWADFSASVGEDRVAQIEALRGLSEGSYPLLNTMSSQVEATGTTFAKSAENMQMLNEATVTGSKNLSEMTAKTYDVDQAVSDFLGNRKGFSAFADSAQDADQVVAEFLGKTNSAINEFGGVGEKLYGPMPAMKSVGFGEAFGEAFNSIGGFLNDLAMPLMATQMIGMAIGQVGQAMYDSAAIAEGPAAHSFGTFTGTVDALGQSLQRAGGQFSEGFGQALLPTLNALNNQAASGDLGALGQFAGGVASTLANLTLITTGVDIWGGTQGLINQGASAMGLPQPFQGPGPANQAQVTYEQSVASMPQTVSNLSYQTRTQSDQLLQMASDPSYLQSQDELQAAQTVYQRAQQRYNSTHYISPQQLLMQYQEQQYDAQQAQNYQYQMDNQPGGFQIAADYWGGFFSSAGRTPPPLSNPNAKSAAQGYGSDYYGQTGYGGGTGGGGIDWGGIFGGIGKSISDIWNAPNGGADTLGMLFDPKAWGFGGQSPQTSMGGCFIAGTPVLMANGSSKPIETLRVDERVMAYDGKKQVPATIIGCIMFPAKQTYELVFSDGKTLTTTDSHPIATPEGWKSISPESTNRENPNLPITTLAVGDNIYTADGTLCRLVSIQTREIAPVYNITVNPHHTYYAGNILVHNAKAHTISGDDLGQQAGEQIGGIQLPHMDLSGMAGQLGGAFSGIQLPHLDLSGMASGLGGAFSGIQLPHIDMSGISGALGGMFSGISIPPIPDIGSQISGALGGMFSGITMPAIPDIGGTISGALSGMFGGISMPSIPDIGGMVSGALSGVFGGITVPSPPEVGGMISGAMSGLFGGVQVPSPPEVGAMINGAMSGIFAGIQIPAPPNLGAQISSAMSGMFSGISLPSVPFFASGVENWQPGGLAVVGEAGPELVSLPSGSSVYPMSAGTGIGGGVSPISFGGGGGGAPQSVNVVVQLDSQSIISAIGLPLSQNIRIAAGMRSY